MPFSVTKTLVTVV